MSKVNKLLGAICTIDTNTTEYTSRNIKVERGPVLGAVVFDNEGNIAKEIGNGVYQFESNNFIYPITVIHGIIDTNRNNQIDRETDFALNRVLKIYETGTKATVLTTVQDINLKNCIKETFNLQEEDLFKLPSEDTLYFMFRKKQI